MPYEDLSRGELEEVVVQLEEELADMEDRAKRIQADFENYKKKQGERQQRWQTAAKKELAKELITVLDNLERAMMSADKDSTLLKGVEMVADELYNTLAKHGLQRIEAENDAFNPQIHTAVDTRPHEEDNKVVETRRHGYIYNDDVIREAEVVVGKNNGAEDGSTSSAS